MGRHAHRLQKLGRQFRIVMSGSASTQATILSDLCLQLAVARPTTCCAGAVEPDTATRRASFTAKLALTPK